MTRQIKASVFERHPATTIATVVAVIVILLDISAANLYKVVVGHSLYAKAEARMAETRYRIKSDIYHHDLKKNMFIERAVWGGNYYSVATDSLGFKSSSTMVTPTIAPLHRILFIGDSFTEGVGIEYPKTFVGIIADSLRQRKIDVLNAGVSSYSPIIYWRKAKYLIEDVGLKFNELVVHIDMSDIQDEATRYSLSDQNTVKDSATVEKALASKAGFSLARSLSQLYTRNSVLMNVPWRRIFRNTEEDDLRRALHNDRSGWALNEKLFDEYGKAGLKQAAHYMDRLLSLTRMHGIKLTVAVYPWPDQIFHGDLDSIQVSFWKGWAKNAGVCFISYYPVFINANSSEQDRRFTIKENFLRGDVHWNEKGHRLIADNFLSLYKNRGQAGHEFPRQPGYPEAVNCDSYRLR